MKNFKITQWEEKNQGLLFVCYLHTDENNNILYSEGEVDVREAEDANTKYDIMENAIRTNTVRNYPLYHKGTVASSVLEEAVINWELRKGWDQ